MCIIYPEGIRAHVSVGRPRLARSSLEPSRASANIRNSRNDCPCLYLFLCIHISPTAPGVCAVTWGPFPSLSVCLSGSGPASEGRWRRPDHAAEVVEGGRRQERHLGDAIHQEVHQDGPGGVPGETGKGCEAVWTD